MEIPSQGRHFPGIHGPKTLKSSSKHFLNRPGHGVVLGGQRLYPPSEVEIASSPPEKLQKGPQQGKYGVCSLRWFLRHQRNAQTPTVET